MQALILVGGEGTRLRPLTLTRPKPALRLVDRPFIRFMFDWVGRHGVDEVVLACGFGTEALRYALGGLPAEGPRIHYLEEPEPLGTAGPIRMAAERGLLGERFLALNGDLLTDLDLSALIELHAARDAVATLGLYPVDDPTHYGLVRRAADGEVGGFVEKPDPSAIDTDEVNAGTYVLERSIVDLIPPGRAVSIEREVFPRLVGQGLFGRRLEGYWMDIGTPERYLQASWDILERRVVTDAGARLDGDGMLVEEAADVDPAAAIEPPALVEAGCAVGPGAVVGARAVVGAGTSVGARAEVSSSILDDGCSVAPGAMVSESILAAGVEVGSEARVGSGAVIGEGARIESGADLGEGARIGPGETVTP
jgi:mannose-1-phosphate guanylyltransferase